MRNKLKGGRPKMACELVRNLTIGVRLNRTEWECIHSISSCAGVAPTTWLRIAALGRTAPKAPVPEINRQAYGELARLAGNLNQMMRMIHSGDVCKMDNFQLPELQRLVQRLRLELLGVKNDSQGD